jgi:hypothetical protein
METIAATLFVTGTGAMVALFAYVALQLMGV